MEGRAIARCSALLAVATGVLLACSPAGAVTVGKASSGTILSCGANKFFTQAARASVSPDYTIPPGGGVIDSWSTGTHGATGGAPITLLVLQPLSSTTYQVVAFDSEVLPNPLPADNIATFSLVQGLSVPGGATLGLYGSGTNEGCSFPAGPQDVVGFGDAPTPAQNATYTQMTTGAGSLLNAAVDLVQSMDAGVVASAAPATIAAGGVGVLGFSISNAGPSEGTLTLNDAVPAGLSVLAAFMDSGRCSTAGKAVICNSGPLAVGSSTPVGVVVSASKPGTFTNIGSLSTSIADTNPANDRGAATLTVRRASSTPPRCRIVALKRVRIRTAKRVLRALGCRIGKVSKRRSARIPKGEVISTSPGPSVQPHGTAVKIVQSAGKPKRKKH